MSMPRISMQGEWITAGAIGARTDPRRGRRAAARSVQSFGVRRMDAALASE